MVCQIFKKSDTYADGGVYGREITDTKDIKLLGRNSV